VIFSDDDRAPALLLAAAPMPDLHCSCRRDHHNHGNSGAPLVDRDGDAVGIDSVLYDPRRIAVSSVSGLPFHSVLPGFCSIPIARSMVGSASLWQAVALR
jgi:hypothetical protein